MANRIDPDQNAVCLRCLPSEKLQIIIVNWQKCDSNPPDWFLKHSGKFIVLCLDSLKHALYISIAFFMQSLYRHSKPQQQSRLLKSGNFILIYLITNHMSTAWQNQQSDCPVWSESSLFTWRSIGP